MNCTRFVAVDEIQDSSFHFPGTEGNEQNESDICSFDWNSKECWFNRFSSFQPTVAFTR